VDRDNSHKLLTQHGYKIIPTKKWGGPSHKGVTKYHKPDPGAYTGSREIINLSDHGWSNITGKKGTHAELSAHLKEAVLQEANATKAHIFHHLTSRGFEYSPVSGFETYHHPTGHSIYISGTGESWYHDHKGKRLAQGSVPGHKVYDKVLAHSKRLTDNIRANELTHPLPEKKEGKSKTKKVNETAELSVGMTSRLPKLKPHKVVEAEPTFSDLRKKLTQKEDIDTNRVPDTVPDFDMAENDTIVPDIGVDDRLFTETDEDENDKLVPADVAVSGRSYTL
jgi:hypothetical protein